LIGKGGKRFLWPKPITSPKGFVSHHPESGAGYGSEMQLAEVK
jgi:hypothetical protein